VIAVADLKAELQQVEEALETTRRLRLKLATRRRVLLQKIANPTALSRQAQEQHRRRAEGLCATCRKPRGDSPSTWKCVSCLDAARDRARDRLGTTMPWTPGRPGRPALPRPPVPPEGEE
jgi:hypothetical protein